MFSKTLGDLWRSRRVWSHLGWRDLRAQYARTGIGPWWSTATLLASIIGTSVAVQLISNGEFREIIPRLSLGLAIWTFWAICLTDGTNMFETERGLLLNTTISELALASRVVWLSRVKLAFEPFPNVTLKQGSVPEILSTLDLKGVSFLHLDLNAAIPEAEALEQLWPQLLPGAIVLFDDYGWIDYAPTKVAHDQVVSRFGKSICLLPTGQGLLIK